MTNEAEIEAVVVGAGAVGLACAAAMARAGIEVLVLETAGQIGSGISARNSEVIHAGIYYPTGSLRHRLCVHGRRMLYPFLERSGVAHQRVGKLIVATNAQEEAQISAIRTRGEENGVEGLVPLSGAEARTLEPNLNCVSALLSPETGIMDAHGYMRALQGEVERHGGAIAFGAPLLRGEAGRDGFTLETGGAAPMRLRCRKLVNAAGLYAQDVARALGVAADAIPKRVLAKGSYFSCVGAPAFTRLIYPAPIEGGLGVHLTLDLNGRMRFGPDVEWLASDDPDDVDYAPDPARATHFYAAIRRYWPALKADALTPDYAGVRPKLSGLGEPAADFRIDGAETHGVAGLVNLFGIESPGLTSSLAIAERVVARLEGHTPAQLTPAVFFDRDGTLNEEIGYAHKPEDLRWIPGAIDAIRAVNAKGWRAIVVTNQSGIARGLYGEAEMHAFHARMQDDLAQAGARVDAFYHCPYHLDAVDRRWRHPDHPDRKPNPGMILRAMREMAIDPLTSIMIGDTDADAGAARAAGLRFIRYEGGDLRDVLGL